MSQTKVVLFDAYGTLLDVHSAMAAHASRLGPQWREISAEWRMKQLEYTWVRSLTGAAHHEDFFLCTRTALRVVLARRGIGDPSLEPLLMDAYLRLAPYPEVPAMLRSLRARGLALAILSNGTPGMLASACEAAGIAGLLDEVLSVEAVGVFKPDPRVYRLPVRQFGVPADRIMFVSGNAWDGQAAHAHGYRVVRVNREGGPDEYGLREEGVPELPDLSGLAALVT